MRSNHLEHTRAADNVTFGNKNERRRRTPRAQQRCDVKFLDKGSAETTTRRNGTV